MLTSAPLFRTGGIHYQKGYTHNGRTKDKERAALTLGCSLRHINRMLAGYKESGKEYFVLGNGELLQMDATPFKWVSGVVWHLHPAIDDA